MLRTLNGKMMLMVLATGRQHCLISYVGGLATIDPHGVKEHAEFHNIPKFV